MILNLAGFLLAKATGSFQRRRTQAEQVLHTRGAVSLAPVTEVCVEGALGWARRNPKHSSIRFISLVTVVGAGIFTRRGGGRIKQEGEEGEGARHKKRFFVDGVGDLDP
ncbi:hypothetical protein BHE74_00056628 [Ensete ventricosum]|nr:hypothetical protein GW17_00035296 [Ensete ventricosum]RWW38161.1 hypothetical protein BHE74_00056628 [Ensete ventricosum]RZS01513.1 hypothetical protein BHM03_00031390 [Ensete ventricosum]